jgi:CP2 transcription factor
MDSTKRYKSRGVGCGFLPLMSDIYSRMPTINSITPETSPRDIQLVQVRHLPVTNRYQVYLDSKQACLPASSQKNYSPPLPLTFLNKNQIYYLCISDTTPTRGSNGEFPSLRIIISLSFQKNEHRDQESRLWKLWADQSILPETGAMQPLETDKPLPLNLKKIYPLEVSVGSDSMDEYKIKPLLIFKLTQTTNAVKIPLIFNCLSTDFSRAKGVKGYPLALNVSIIDENSFYMEDYACAMQIFRDKGADRKYKEEQRKWQRNNHKNEYREHPVTTLKQVRVIQFVESRAVDKAMQDVIEKFQFGAQTGSAASVVFSCSSSSVVGSSIGFVTPTPSSPESEEITELVGMDLDKNQNVNCCLFAKNFFIKERVKTQGKKFRIDFESQQRLGWKSSVIQALKLEVEPRNVLILLLDKDGSDSIDITDDGFPEYIKNGTHKLQYQLFRIDTIMEEDGCDYVRYAVILQ